MPKKTKAIKVTDKDKPWNRKKERHKYKVESKPVHPTFLIVCEGHTEQLYFKSFPVLSVTVKAVELGGVSKLKLVESIESIVKDSDQNYDQIWCVFDMDYKQGGIEFSKFDNAIRKGKDLGYRIAYSNDSFELWFYLHFEYNDNENLRKFYYKKLSRFWGVNYEKEGKKYEFCAKNYNRLKDDDNASQEKAIQRAKKLYEKKKNLVYHFQNPVTKVHDLVIELNKSLRK